jgi:hypothetical protein
LSKESVEELGKRAEDVLKMPAGSSPDAILAALDAQPDGGAVKTLADLLPRGDVLDHVVSSIPSLPDGTANSPAALRDHLFATYQPGQVWWPFIIAGAVSCALMIGYDRWARARSARS